MGPSRDHRTAQEKWEQLMAEARHRPSLFVHRGPLPDCREHWPATTRVNRTPFNEEASNVLSRRDLPESCLDETEAEVTVNITTLKPLSAGSDDHDDETETRCRTIIKTLKESRNPTVSADVSHTTRLCSQERYTGTCAGPPRRYWCSWDEEDPELGYEIHGSECPRLNPEHVVLLGHAPGHGKYQNHLGAIGSERRRPPPPEASLGYQLF